jgi:hypothetical protein
MVDILALQKQLSDLEAEVTRLSNENDQLTALLIFADLRINKLVEGKMKNEVSNSRRVD